MTDIITPSMAAERIEIAAANGWLKQKTWHDGGHIACLLGSIDASVRNTDAPCLAHVAPKWLLEWTVVAFDGLAKARLADAATLYAQMLRDGDGLTPSQWERVSVEFRCWLISDALKSARPKSETPACWPSAESACLEMIGALRSGDATRIEAAREAAAVAATAAVRAAAWAAAWAAAEAAVVRAAAWAAWAAAEAEVARYRQFEALARIVREIRLTGGGDE